MIETPMDMRAKTHELTTATWTLAALAALFEAGLAEPLASAEGATLDELAAKTRGLSRSVIARCLAVVASVGMATTQGDRHRLAPGAIAFTQPPMRAALMGDLRAMLTQALSFLDSASGDAPMNGWSYEDPKVLQAQGDASGAFAPMFKTNIVPSMDDLGARLERPGARFLDVGVGVASLAISMCRAFPQLATLGVDMSEKPLELARANVARAGLEGRLELRCTTIEALDTPEAFDLAWLPAVFIPEAVLPRAITQVRRCLKPGGWVIMPTGVNPNATEQARSVFALCNELWGGPVLSLEAAEGLLKDGGFTATRAIAGPTWAPALMVGRR